MYFYKISEVIAKTTLSRSTIYDYIKKGIFPAPKRLTANRVGWLSSDVDAWIAGRI